MGAVTREEVISALALDVALVAPGTPDGEWLETCVRSVNAYAPRVCPRLRDVPDADPWPDDIQQGLIMQSGALFQRRASMGGAVQTYESTGPTFVPRWDPDVERLLGIGPWTPGASA